MCRSAAELRGVFLCTGGRPGAVPRARGANRAVLHEFGIAGNVKTPALVLCEMPVEAVELVARHQVENRLHRLLAEEVAAFVEVNPAPAVARRILDLDDRDLDAVLPILRSQLLQRLKRVESAGVVGRDDLDAVLCDGKTVALLRDRGVRLVFHNRAGVALAFEDSLALHGLARRGHELQRCRRGCSRQRSRHHQTSSCELFHDAILSSGCRNLHAAYYTNLLPTFQ